MRHQMFDNKNKAINWIWNIKVKDAEKDMQRAFNIWRGALNYDKLKK